MTDLLIRPHTRRGPLNATVAHGATRSIIVTNSTAAYAKMPACPSSYRSTATA